MDPTPIYTFLSKIGMNILTRRFIFGGVLVAILEYIFKPFWAFTAEGELRPWAVLHPDEPGTTYLPFLALPLLSGFVFSMFI